MLEIKERDYVPDGAGGLRRAEGREALLQRVLFRLMARRGQFPFLEDLGSSLWRLGRVSAAARQSAAEQYVAEALTTEEGLTVEAVTLTQENDMAHVIVQLTYQGEALSVTLAVP
ncbi:hypothetical protein [Dysosmobacter sp.]|uniref:hypothetical protein n=1 Tax=Dysosmobacter sp. TaxID=2591382 RepID=UPI003A8ECA87